MRPLYVTILFIWILLTPNSFAETIPASKYPVILVLGDSLSAGFGIDQSQGWVSLMAKQLKQNGYSHTVVNASISGETSAGGLSRLPELLKQQPDIVIIELGANDGLRGLPLNRLKANLDKMISLSILSGAKVLLIGMKLPPNYGPVYTNGFEDIYQELAKTHKTKVLPFLLSGVATRRELMQEDNLHPTSDAQPLLLKNVWPLLEPLLKVQPTG